MIKNYELMLKKINMNNEKTTNLNLNLLSQYQSGSFISLNENFNIIDSILNNSLKGNINGEDTPPINPENFLYFVGSNPTNEWNGDSSFLIKSHIAKYNQESKTWIFIKPNSGLILWHEDNKKIYVFSESKFNEI